MVRIRTAAALVALLLAATLVGCGADARVAEAGTIRVAVTDPLPVVRTQILAATNSNFFSVNNTLTVEPDVSFGTAQVVSNHPLRVRYTVRAGVVWSDGVPVDAADLLLAWAAGAGVLGPPAAVGLRDAPTVPVLGYDGRSVIVEYNRTLVDWRLAFSVGLPAHVVAREAFGSTTDESAKRAVIAAVRSAEGHPGDGRSGEGRSGQGPGLSALAAAYAIARAAPSSTAGFGAATLLSSGPFRIVGDASRADMLVLEANPHYMGNRRPQVGRVEVHRVADDAAAIAALADGTVDVVAPAATATAAKAVMDLADVTVVGGWQAAYHALTLQAGDPGDAFADVRVREAFLESVPRRALVDELVTPLQEDASVESSFVFAPGAVRVDTDEAAGDGAGGAVRDDAGAGTAVRDGAGDRMLQGQEVCVLYNASDAAQAREFELIRDSAQRVGFVVTDCSRSDWRAALEYNKDYDAALVDWNTATTPGSGSAPPDAADRRPWAAVPETLIAATRPTVDTLFSELEVTADDDDRTELLVAIDAQLFGDAVGLPLFQRPTLTAFRSTVEGIQRSPGYPGVFGNLWNWHLSTRG
jgi:peptide/nickel transport system substrate-binding protein